MNRIRANSGKLFHELLVRCLAEQHQPTAEEIDLVAGKIWYESHGARTGQLWPEVARDSDTHRQMMEAAMMVLNPPALSGVAWR